MTTEKSFDSMLLMLDYLTPILEDPDARALRDMIRPKEDAQEKTEYSTADLIAKLFPLMIGKHRNELYGIIGILNDTAPELVKDMPFSEIKKILKDENILKDFFDFFPWLLQMALRV